MPPHEGTQIYQRRSTSQYQSSRISASKIRSLYRKIFPIARAPQANNIPRACQQHGADDDVVCAEQSLDGASAADGHAAISASAAIQKGLRASPIAPVDGPGTLKLDRCQSGAKTKLAMRTPKSLFASALVIVMLLEPAGVFSANSPANAERPEKQINALKSATIFSLGQIGFAGQIEKTTDIFEAIQLRPDSRSAYLEILNDPSSSPAGLAFATCGLARISKSILAASLREKSIRQIVLESPAVPTMRGDILQTENLFRLVHRFIAVGC